MDSKQEICGYHPVVPKVFSLEEALKIAEKVEKQWAGALALLADR